MNVRKFTVRIDCWFEVSCLWSVADMFDFVVLLHLAFSPKVRLFKGHRDGVWDLALSRHSPIVLGTASADFTARIWCMENEACLLQYVGHTGSVNSIRFHPSQGKAGEWKSLGLALSLVSTVQDFCLFFSGTLGFGCTGHHGSLKTSKKWQCHPFYPLQS